MERVEKSIEIVHYRPELARTVAEMWNRSKEGWGGHADIRTEEQVQSEEANSTNIHTYIALDGNKAVGYCGLSEYHDDEGALYVPLLNVRTDYHGKKIGKKLILTALEETTKRGWPRLDLYTWAGNTKAVPLYKKCGFFWEDRDDSVHLMNFLPTVLSTPLFTEFFNHVDWYKDSVREIKVEPDDQKIGDFEIYDYRWKRDDLFLSVSFEKTSRGICEIKSNEYAVSMELPVHKLVYGKEYPVRFVVENYSDKPLNIAVQGKSHRNIRFDMETESIVQKNEVIEGNFYIEPVLEEQNTRKTHPYVKASLLINGKEITFKKGLLPLAPVKCSGKLQGTISPLDVEDTAYVEFENNCPFPVKVSFQLPEAENVFFQKRDWEIWIEEKQKTTIAVPYLLKKAVFYDEAITVRTETTSGEVIEYEQRLSFPFNTIGSFLTGECQDNYHLYSGRTRVVLKKDTNGLFYERGRGESSEYYFLYPKLGKPYSEEYTKMKPSDVSFYQDINKVGLKLVFPSRDFPNIFLTRVIELTGEGLMSQQYLIENRGDEVVHNIHLHSPFVFPLVNAKLPYDNNVVHSPGTYNSEVNVWDEKRVTENWLFSAKGSRTASVIWQEGIPIHFQRWHLHYFEEQIKSIQPHAIALSQKVWFGQNVFVSVEEVREFAGQQEVRATKSVDELQFQPKGEYPFVEENDGIVSFKPFIRRNSEVDLKISYSSMLADGEKIIEEKSELDAEAISTWDVTVPLGEERKAIVPIWLKGSLSSQGLERKTLLFPVGNEPVALKEEWVNGHLSLEVNNGHFSFKAAPSFYPGIYSLCDQQIEWLDTSYPTAKPRAWWNPWVGGISFTLSGLISRKLITSPSEGKFVTVFDQFGGKWSGIQLTTRIEDHQTFKGLIYHQYAVTRPDSPVLAIFTRIEQRTGHHFYGTKEHVIVNLVPGEKSGDLRFKTGVNGEQGENYQYHNHETLLYQLSDILFEREGAKNKLHFIPNTKMRDMDVYMTQEIVMTGCEHFLYTKAGTVEITDPRFFVLSEETHSLRDYAQLRSIRFSLS